MIKSVCLKNFKSFLNASISMQKLTLLTGLNSSGKSTLMQALRMYNQAANQKSPFLSGHGGFDEVRSKFASNTSNIDITLDFENQQETLTISQQEATKPKKCPVFLYVGADRLGPQPNLPLAPNSQSDPEIGEKGEYVLGFIQSLIEQNYLLPKELLQAGSASQTFEQVLQDWLAEITPGVTFSARHFKQADTAHAQIDGHRPTNVGFGLSYTLPIIAAALGVVAYPASAENNEFWVDEWEQKKSSNGVLLLLENPEAHLHPKGQTAMGRLLALCANQGVQIVVETHSEHVMDGIRIAINQGLISHTYVKFHYFSKDEQGLSHIKTPQLDANAKLDSWPEAPLPPFKPLIYLASLLCWRNFGVNPLGYRRWLNAQSTTSFATHRFAPPAGLLDVKLGKWEPPDHGLQQSVTALVTGKSLAKLQPLWEKHKGRAA